MNKVEIFYKKVIEAVCKECGTDPVMMFSNNKERNVDARGVAITILADRKLSDNIISDLTGMTRQAVNRMRNLYPDRIRRSYYLRRTVESVKEELSGMSEGALCCKACDLSMKKFSYNKIFCDICGVKGDFVASSSNQPWQRLCCIRKVSLWKYICHMR